MTPRNDLPRRKLKTSSKLSRQAQTKKNFHYQATLWIFQLHLQVLQKVSRIWTQPARHFNEKRYHLAVGQKLSWPQLCKDAVISPQALRKVLSWCYSMGLIICLPKISWITKNPGWGLTCLPSTKISWTSKWINKLLMKQPKNF